MADKRKHSTNHREQIAKRKPTKTVDQKFKADYTLKFPFFTKSRLSDYHAHCQTCAIDFSVAHGGLNDCTKHLATIGHIRKSKAASESTKITSFCVRDTDFAPIKAEVLFTNFIIEHNLPIAVADHASHLFKSMFPDSKFAGQYACARTKTTAIVETLGDCDDKNISTILKTQPFSVATDGSTDMADTKLYPIVVKYFDKALSKVVCVLLTIVECDKPSTGENIFNIMDTELRKREIDWKNCICLSSDNASVMMGKYKGVASYVTKQVPSVYVLGCPCHLMHLAASKAGKELPCDIEEFLVDIFYYLDKSSNRQQYLKLFQKMCGTEERKILKFVSTRWLSLGQCLQRVLDQWDPLYKFFQSESEKKKPKIKTTSSSHTASKASAVKATHSVGSDVNKASRKSSHITTASKHSTAKAIPCEKVTASKSSDANSFDISKYIFKQTDLAIQKAERDSKAKETLAKEQKTLPNDKVGRVLSFFKSRTNKLYCLFLTTVLPLFETANVTLQNEAPCIHILRRVLVKQLRELMIRFVKPEHIANSHAIHTDVQYQNPDNQKLDTNLFIGKFANDYIDSHTGLRTETFFKSVRAFYVAACKYMIAKFPYDDQLLANAEVADPTMWLEKDFSFIAYFMDRFSLIPPQDIDRLQGQFLNYQVDTFDNPESTSHSINKFWANMAQAKDDNQVAKYDLLARVMLSILVIFHSNVDCERLFSIVTKNKTNYRPNLSTRTLSCLLTHKMSMIAEGRLCHTYKPDNELLKKAKRSTAAKLHAQALQKQSSL